MALNLLNRLFLLRFSFSTPHFDASCLYFSNLKNAQIFVLFNLPTNPHQSTEYLPPVSPHKAALPACVCGRSVWINAVSKRIRSRLPSALVASGINAPPSDAASANPAGIRGGLRLLLFNVRDEIEAVEEDLCLWGWCQG